MSRVGNAPVAIPAGVEVKLDGHIITVKGPKGELTRALHPDMIIEVGDQVVVKRPSESKNHKIPSWVNPCTHQQHGDGCP